MNRKAQAFDGPVVYVGVDPAQRANGVAWRLNDGPINTFCVVGIENIGGQENTLAHLRDRLNGCVKCVALIESPDWSGVGTRETRAAAHAWERWLLANFEHRKINIIAPRHWQQLLLTNCPGTSTKEKAIWRARNLNKLTITSDHEADAVAIMEFAKMADEGSITIPSKRGKRR